MSRGMKEKAGPIRDLSSENRGGKLFLRTGFYVLTRPVCLVVWWISWSQLVALCRYGGIRRHVPILALCLLWWICVLVSCIRLWKDYNQGKCRLILRPLFLSGGGLKFAGTDEKEAGKKMIIAESLVKWYVKRQDYCQLFLRNKTVLTLDLRELSMEERDFLNVKLSAVGVAGKGTWRTAAGIFLCVVMLYGSVQVAESAIPYQGKLAWFLQDLRDVRTVTLRHDNVFESGVQGILEDIRTKVELPETLCLATSFNLHFLPDGRIQTLDTMLCGFDEEGDFTDSYLISYNAAHSEKIKIRLHGAAGTDYRPEKSLEPLVEAVSVIPLEEIVDAHPEEACFGILYYGVREWSSMDEIQLLDRNGGEDRTRGQGLIAGYTISVFCPENGEAPPVRYIY